MASQSPAQDYFQSGCSYTTGLICHLSFNLALLTPKWSINGSCSANFVICSDHHFSNLNGIAPPPLMQTHAHNPQWLFSLSSRAKTRVSFFIFAGEIWPLPSYLIPDSYLFALFCFLFHFAWTVPEICWTRWRYQPSYQTGAMPLCIERSSLPYGAIGKFTKEGSIFFLNCYL